MSLIETILDIYPELAENINLFFDGTIILVNDSDGLGDYIEKWEYFKPIPKGLTLGKP
jgi:hypothetical protein